MLGTITIHINTVLRGGGREEGEREGSRGERERREQGNNGGREMRIRNVGKREKVTVKIEERERIEDL